MATIEVGGINERSAPSPAQLQTWHDDWTPQLPNLTNWEPEPQGSRTNFRCTTTANVNQTEAVVDPDLTTWVEADPGHRHYSVS
jgi:hypothetical protein